MLSCNTGGFTFKKRTKLSKHTHTHTHTESDITLWFNLNYSESRYIFMRHRGNCRHFPRVSRS